MEPITDVRDISHIAYGFMASKVLFASLHLDLYSRLAEHPKTLHQLATETGIASHRLLTLLTACRSLGLLTREHETYRNAPASARYLVRGAPAYFGDYFRFQVDRHVYPHLEHLDAALRGEPTPALYDLMADEDEAAHFTRAQHAGSLGPAAVLTTMVNLSHCHTLLDVAGGSGAFSITLCRRYPALRATLIDFPQVIATAQQFVAASGVAQQIACIAGDALTVPWPQHQDVVLMSYLLSAVSQRAIRQLLEQAYSALRPGGLLLLHDFMVDDDRTGPPTAALWFTVFLSNPEAISFTPGWLGELMSAQGFAVEEVREVIPSITKLLVAKKPCGDTC
jgi:ubiquinone/menaquinone biosynthesis C-methylase UbiE